MALEFVTVPCLSDNYAFLIHNAQSDETALVDAPEAAPILAELEQRGWALSSILLTHHHDDHIDGVGALVSAHGATVFGAKADAHRLPKLDRALSPGDRITICGADVDIWDVSGHTIGHIAFVLADHKAAFTADSLMALGCGRLFEGTPEQMWQSLVQFQTLPDDTVIYSGHEYTAANGRFAITVDPDNADLQARINDIARTRDAGGFTVPSQLGLERATNPFLRAADPAIRANLGLSDASDASVFAAIRKLKDNF